MTIPAYTVPDNPADPEQAALELIVRVPAEILDRHPALREALQYVTSMLDAERCFAGISWHDAKHAATAIMVDAIGRDDAADALRQRAGKVHDGSDNMRWDDRAAMAQTPCYSQLTRAKISRPAERQGRRRQQGGPIGDPDRFRSCAEMAGHPGSRSLRCRSAQPRQLVTPGLFSTVLVRALDPF